MKSEPRPRMTGYQRDDALGRWRVVTCEPSPQLAPLVETMWFGEGRVSYQRDRIFPGGSAFLLINLGPPQYLIEAGPPVRRRPFVDIWVSGLQQGPIETEAPHGNMLLGVAFRAGALRSVLHTDAHHLTDQTLPLADVLGDSAMQLRDRLLDSNDLAQRFASVERWLVGRLTSGRNQHPAVQRTLSRLHASAGRRGIQSLACEVGLSRRALSTAFQIEVGVSPKAFARLLRFKSALTLLGGRDQRSLAELAAHCGYFDQSHLARDFRQFSGFAPGQLLRQPRPDASSAVVC